MLSMENRHWTNTTFDGFPVDVTTIKCGEDKLLYDDYEKLKKFLKSPLREIHEYSYIRKEYESMFKHLDRYHDEIVFIKCKDKSCCVDFGSQHLFHILKSCEFKLLAPTADGTCQNHYNTFIQEAR